MSDPGGNSLWRDQDGDTAFFTPTRPTTSKSPYKKRFFLCCEGFKPLSCRPPCGGICHEIQNGILKNGLKNAQKIKYVQTSKPAKLKNGFPDVKNGCILNFQNRSGEVRSTHCTFGAWQTLLNLIDRWVNLVRFEVVALGG